MARRGSSETEALATVSQLPGSDPEGILSLGTSLALIASTMTFASLLLLHWILRLDAPTWPPPGSGALPRMLPVCATLIIAASSWILHRGVQGVALAKQRRLPQQLALSLGLGLLFLALIALLWGQLWLAGFRSQNPHGGTFYFITFFHASHVLAALALLGWMLRGARLGRYHVRNVAPLRLAARFWHFLGLNWLLIFLCFFAW